MPAANTQRDYVPALGQHWLTPLYDTTIALTTREGRWRRALLGLVDPRPGDVILDIGCGTGTLATALKTEEPEAEIIGLDPDPEVLRIAGNKAARAGVSIKLVEGFGDELGAKASDQPVNKIVSSLVFHQVPLEGKISTLKAAFGILPQGGQIFIADFGEQRSPLMRFCFGAVQRLDGYEFTQPNAEGCLPVILREVGFGEVRESMVIPTMFGSISLYSARKADRRGGGEKLSQL